MLLMSAEKQTAVWMLYVFDDISIGNDSALQDKLQLLKTQLDLALLATIANYDRIIPM